MNSLKQFFQTFGIVLLLSLLASTASAQSAGKVTISGVVSSAEDNSPLLGVAVVVVETMQGVTSNFDGTYSIDAVAGNTL